MARTQEQRKAETRGRLLAAASELFARDGYDAVSVDAIGDLAERTSGSVYAHFGGKQGLLLALVEGFAEDLAAVIDAEFAVHQDLPSRLLAVWRNVDDHPKGPSWFLLEIELWIRSQRDEELDGPLADRYRLIYELLGGEIRAWVQHFDLNPPVPLDELPAAVIGTLIGLQMQHRLNPSSVTEELALRVLLALFGERSPELPT